VELSREIAAELNLRQFATRQSQNLNNDFHRALKMFPSSSLDMFRHRVEEEF
jgi:hypothetical protein